MNRLTKAYDNIFYIMDDTKVQHDENGFFGDAVLKLAKFENVYADLLTKQDQLAKELEKLKFLDKTKTVKFKQLLVNKISNNNMIILFETYGIK